MAAEPIPLMRSAVRDLLSRELLSESGTGNAHPGLLIDRGLRDWREDDSDTKAQHIDRICATGVDALYRNAYARWEQATDDPSRFRSLLLRLDGRLFAGLSGGGMLETGCAISHSYGTPYIPGSSIKGVVQHQVRHTEFGAQHPSACNELFGAAPTAEQPQGLSGLITFHDAWWVPDSAATPLVKEVVTTHHPDYYRSEGQADATDLDSPIPNAQIGVRGSFLFTLQGSLAWLELAEQMLLATMAEHGVGAKTRSGYGFLHQNKEDKDGLERTRRRRADEREARERTRRDEEQHRQEEERRKREFDDLSTEGQQVELVRLALDAYLGRSATQRRQERSQFVGKLNAVTKEAALWEAPSDREAAAKCLERCYDEIGWVEPGKTKQQKKRQEEKRRGNIATLRGESPA